MEVAESNTTAENVAKRWASTSSPDSSAHLCCDPDSAVECVKPADTAWAAPGANADGYHVELAGFARQSEAEWLDAASKATIRNAVPQVKQVMKDHSIPARWLTDAQLADGVSAGHTTHAQVSRVFRKSDHSDPGPSFPAAFVMEQFTAKPAAAKPDGLAGDGLLGEATIRRWQQVMGTTVDGVISKPSSLISAVQRVLKSKGLAVSVDGDFGPQTIRALQCYFGQAQDGVLSKPSPTIRSLQHRLSAGSF